MYFKRLIQLAFTLVFFNCFSQENQLKLEVKDEQGKPLPFAHIIAFPGEQIFISDNKGIASFDSANHFDSLRVTSVGFKPYVIAKSEMKNGDLTVKLPYEVYLMDELVVTGMSNRIQEAFSTIKNTERKKKVGLLFEYHVVKINHQKDTVEEVKCRGYLVDKGTHSNIEIKITEIEKQLFYQERDFLSSLHQGARGNEIYGLYAGELFRPNKNVNKYMQQKGKYYPRWIDYYLSSKFDLVDFNTSGDDIVFDLKRTDRMQSYDVRIYFDNQVNFLSKFEFVSKWDKNAHPLFSTFAKRASLNENGLSQKKQINYIVHKGIVFPSFIYNTYMETINGEGMLFSENSFVKTTISFKVLSVITGKVPKIKNNELLNKNLPLNEIL